MPYLNPIPVLPGVFNPSFISPTETPLDNILPFPPAATVRDKVDRIRRDIRRFKRGVEGHTTVFWSGSVERESDVVFNEEDEVRNPLHTPKPTFSLSPR